MTNGDAATRGRAREFLVSLRFFSSPAFEFRDSGRRDFPLAIRGELSENSRESRELRASERRSRGSVARRSS